MKKLLLEDIEFDIFEVYVLFSFARDRDIETKKFENILRSVPNVTVTRGLETIKRPSRTYIKTIVKFNSMFIGDRTPEKYVRDVLIPSIKKNIPFKYRPSILDWKMEGSYGSEKSNLQPGHATRETS